MKDIKDLKELCNNYKTPEEVRELHNEAMLYFRYENDLVYTMEEFFINESNKDAKTVSLSIHHGDFNPYHDYAGYDGYDNYKSYCFVSEFVNYDLMFEYLEETGEEF